MLQPGFPAVPRAVAQHRHPQVHGRGTHSVSTLYFITDLGMSPAPAPKNAHIKRFAGWGPIPQPLLGLAHDALTCTCACQRSIQYCMPEGRPATVCLVATEGQRRTNGCTLAAQTSNGVTHRVVCMQQHHSLSNARLVALHALGSWLPFGYQWVHHRSTASFRCMMTEAPALGEDSGVCCTYQPNSINTAEIQIVSRRD
jgi:hypothetical protein